MNKAANVRLTNELKNPSEAGTYYRLLCMTGPSKGKVYYLLSKRAVIGRGENADIQIVDVKISREHAELSFASGAYTITDLGAQNGIIVNDEKVKQKKLEDSEKIVIGQTVFKYNVIIVSESKELASVEDSLDVNLSKDSTKNKKGKLQAKTNLRQSSFDNNSRDDSGPTKKGGSKTIVMFLIVGVVLFVLFSGDDKKEPKQAKSTQDPKDLNDSFSEVSLKKPTTDDVEAKKKLV